MNKYNIECFTKMCQENWHIRKCNNNVVKPPLLVTFKTINQHYLGIVLIV